MSEQPRWIADYVDEVARQLGVGPDRTDILDEVRDHLLEGAAAHWEKGLSEEAAAAEAKRDFGEPGLVAAGLRPVVAQIHSRELAWRLLRGVVALACSGVLGFLFLSVWLGAIPDHNRADPVGITAGVTAARLLGASTLVMFWVAYRQRLWAGPRRARSLLLLCVGAEWLLTFAWLVCVAIVGARLAVIFTLPGAPVWSIAAAILGGSAAFKLTSPLAGTRLLLAGQR
jgi:hypothetical protein